MIALLALAIGMLTGAFMNACAYQIPLERPCFRWYRCSACGTALAWHEVIPVWSWWKQGGRSRCCGTPLDSRYLWTDIILGLAYLLLWTTYPPAQAIAYSVLAAGLLLASLVDVDHRIIPDRCSLGGIAAGLIFSMMVPSLMRETSSWAAVEDSLVGMAIGGGVMGLVALVGGAVTSKEAMGLGDIKLLAALGAFLGWQSIPWIIFSGSLLACLILFPRILRPTGQGTDFAFGPFLALGAMSWLAGGRQIMQNYTVILFPHL
jgi:leader peptidase (prepilin peptidase)/N-methyltransferase